MEKEIRKQLNFKIDPELLEEFKVYSIRKQRSMADLMKEMIKNAIELGIYEKL